MEECDNFQHDNKQILNDISIVRGVTQVRILYLIQKSSLNHTYYQCHIFLCFLAVILSFLSGIYGTIERYVLLEEILSQAKTTKKTVHLTCFDL